MPSPEPGAYELAVARSAARAIAEELPEAVAAAVIEFVTGPLLVEPRRVGRELVGPLAGTWSARRGTYRVLYRIDDTTSHVVVLVVDHRADAYGPRSRRRRRPRSKD